WGAGLPNRRVEHSLEARHRIAGVIRATQADVLFAPFAPDAHPDHRAVTRLVEDARFDAKLTAQPMPGDQGRAPRYPRWLFHYYATHLRLVPAPSFLLDVSAARPQKRQSILAYHSQFVANPANRHVPDWIDAAGVYFGSRIGAAFAEPFFTHEPLGLRALNDLV
ncbi:MAG TPA: hypothetical protein VD963_02805, partial [Phycisphaerales bacterium]|nr:hypothetical protein [Phycisphaerales bacterium]